MFAGNYAPEGWAFCDGALLNINQHNTLYALIGITYGGDGVTNFALPDLRGKLPIGQGNGGGLTPRTLAQHGGSEQVSLTEREMPAHTHAANATKTEGTQTSPDGGIWAATVNTTNTPATPVNQYILKSEVLATDKISVMDSVAIKATGGNGPHNNVMPYLSLNFIIALQGLWPDKA